MSDRSIDFIVIGAQKSATTSLFNYLKYHPKIFIPPIKEIKFFIQGKCDQRSFRKHMKKHFGCAPADALWGTVTPQYMMDLNGVGPMSEFAPEARLIAIIRNPIERAISHYMMNRRRRIESRDLCKALRDCLDPSNLIEARNIRLRSDKDELSLYLSAGEYGRMLEQYLRFYSKQQILVIILDSLVADPQHEIDRILIHLGLEAGYSPPDLGKRYFVGGGRPVGFLARKFLGLRKLVTGRDATIEGWASSKDGPTDAAVEVDLPVVLRTELQAFFRADLERLRRKFGICIPWSEFE